MLVFLWFLGMFMSLSSLLRLPELMPIASLLLHGISYSFLFLIFDEMKFQEIGDGKIVLKHVLFIETSKIFRTLFLGSDECLALQNV